MTMTKVMETQSTTTRARNVTAVRDARKSAKLEQESLTKRMQFMDFVMVHVVPVLPEGAELSDNQYSYYLNQMDITVPEVEGREWRGLDGTMGIIYRIRKGLGIKKLERHVSAWGGSVSHSFSGHFTKGDRTVYITIRLGNQLPPTCKIEWEEKEVTSIQKVGKVVCE